MATEKQKRFAFEYVRDFNGTKAAIRAGYAESGADTQASRLLDIAEIQELIEEHKETIALVAQLSPAWVLKQWMQIASADPNDLVSVKVVPCPDCWLPEMGLDMPNPQCLDCKGLGQQMLQLADTRKLTGASRRLFANAKTTKFGIEIEMRDQDGALKSLASYLGMEKRISELSGPGGGPLQIDMNKPYEEMSDAELEFYIRAKAAEEGLLGVDTGVSEKVLPVTIDAKRLKD